MLIVEASQKYVTDRGLARTPIYSAVRFSTMMGDVPIAEITQDSIDKFHLDAKAKGWSASTIKGTIKDLRTLTRHFCGFSPVIRVPVRKPSPTPTPIEEIKAIWDHLSYWSRQWLIISYWCCLRLDDSIRLQLLIASEKVSDEKSATLAWEAGKTNKEHKVPVPKWMQEWLQPTKLPFTRVSDWAQDLVRDELKQASEAAKCDQVYPKHIRQRGLTEWKLASPDAGSIIHGSGLGILDHYVPGVDILRSAMPRVRLPDCFGADGKDKQPEEALLTSFRLLDPQARELVMMTAQRMGRN